MNHLSQTEINPEHANGTDVPHQPDFPVEDSGDGGGGNSAPAGFSLSVNTRKSARAGEGLVPVVPKEWTPTAVVEVMANAGSHDGGAFIHLFSPHHFANRRHLGTSMVCCRVVRLDDDGREIELSDDDVHHLKSVLGDGRNFHVATPGRKELVVLILLNRPITSRQQPVNDDSLGGLFNRAALGASALLESAISAAGLQTASEAILPASNRRGTPEYEKGEDKENGRSFRRALGFKRVSGVAALPILGFRQEVQIPLDTPDQDVRFGHPAFVSNRPLYSPEELASHAPAPEDALDQDEATSFLSRLRSSTYRDELQQRLVSTQTELASANAMATRLQPVSASDLEQALATLAAFTGNLALVNKMRTDAGLAPVGYRSQPYGMAHQSNEKISDPVALFRFMVKAMFQRGEIHAATLNGGPPIELDVPMDQLGWRPLEGGKLRGGVPWEHSGPCVAWIEAGKDQLLLDLAAVLNPFREAGLKRCVDLCVSPNRFARVMAEADLLTGTDVSAVARKINSQSRRVYRVKFKKFFLG
ncbi:MAG: hypothetical protein DPW14_12105 [Planctomycetes bacterium]|nr:hypothetical protein [Planctomycetota bacterium]